jgi:wyosine [tRNA(Phe)-imidazoG37] synthetase (radical SAM superfamily)
VDLVPMKTCCFNCIYCQLRPTEHTTIERRDYTPVAEVLTEVRAKLAEGPQPDYVTLGGSGEPTLHLSFGKIAEDIRELDDTPLALLTNGALFYLPEVRSACAAVDLVLPSLDAGDEETFQRINRPHPELTLEKTVSGLAELRAEFAGQIWLEVFIVKGLNSSDEQVQRIAACIERIRPDRVQINTAVRPPAEGEVAVPSPERLEDIREMLGPGAEVIVGGGVFEETPGAIARKDQVLAMLRRRPCTVADVAEGLGTHPNEVLKHLQRLLEERAIQVRQRLYETFYEAVEH